MPTVAPARPLAARLWLGWTLLWATLVSLVQIVPNLVALALWPTARTFWRWLRVWSRLILGGAGIRVRARGAAAIGPVVYVANHQSMLDIPVLTLAIGAPFVFVARAGLGRLPVVGAILRYSRCVLVDRRAPGGAEAALAEAAERLAAGEAVLFFPEGTRSYGADLGAFYPGAFRLAESAGVPVVPVAVDGAWRLINERERTARPGRVHVRIGRPMAPNAGEDAGALAERAHAEVARLLAVEGAAPPRSPTTAVP